MTAHHQTPPPAVRCIAQVLADNQKRLDRIAQTVRKVRGH